MASSTNKQIEQINWFLSQQKGIECLQKDAKKSEILNKEFKLLQHLFLLFFFLFSLTRKQRCASRKIHCIQFIIVILYAQFGQIYRNTSCFLPLFLVDKRENKMKAIDWTAV